MKDVISILLCSLFLTACTQPKQDETISGYVSPHAVWILQTLNGTAVGPEVTLSFPEKGRIFGNAPCNSYSGQQTAPLPWFNVAGVLSTKKACPDLALEGKYFRALEAATMAEVLGDTLLLSGENVSLVFLRKEL